MSGPLTSASAAFVAKNSRIPPYAIEQSLRFDGGSKLERTNSDNGDSRSFTLSYWIKKTYLGDNNNSIVGTSDGGSNWSYISYGESSSDPDQLIARSSGSNSGYSNGYVFNAQRKHRDPSAWQHHFLVVDKTAGTSKGYINGVLDEGDGGYGGTRSSNGWTLNGTTATVRIGTHSQTGTSNYLNGYLADWYFVDGTAMDVTDFGGFDDYGVWRPINPSISSYGTNGYYLKFDSTAANGVGHDHSGNGNNWTASGFTTSGTATDVFSDTPTTNYATLNPLYKPVSGATFSEGNLKVAYPSSPPTGMHVGTLATINAFYVEAKATAATSDQIYLGVESPDRGNINNSYPGGGPDGWGYGMNGRIYNNGSTVIDTGTTYTTNDIIGVACDPSSGTVEFFKNGASVYSGTSVASVPLTICVSQSGGSGNSGTIEINCGQREFAYPPGTASATDYFNTVLYTGNGSTQSITGVGFQPDFVIAKNRDSTNSFRVVDAVRGVGIQLYTNDTIAEETVSTGLTSFDSDGFSLGSSGGINGSGIDFAAWCWKAGGTASSNTDGTLTSSVSANNDAGFSVCTYTGAGGTSDFGHGLDTAPSVVIVKNRDASSNWNVYHSALGNTQYINLNNANSAGSTANMWNNTSPTSSVVHIGTDNTTSGNSFVAYCFAEKTGVSKFGSYTGTGAAGNYVELGFKPAAVILKRSGGSASHWYLYDSERGADTYVLVNSANAETNNSAEKVLLTQNGFLLQTSAAMNTSGAPYIYMAFAENLAADDSYKSLNTANLPAPTIKDGSDYFNTVLYTGTGSSLAVTGVGFQPDWTWIKNRGRSSSSHVLVDAVRGATKTLSSNLTSAEVTTNGTDDFKSFDTDGFTVGPSSNYFVNSTSDTHVAWNWLAGNGTSSNTDGSITSTVSANPTAGFSIVSYTGTGANATVGHGLGVAPSMIIFKNRDDGGTYDYWSVYHSAYSPSSVLYLNTTDSAGSATSFFDTAPTSTVFQVKTENKVNGSGDDHIAYCFAEVEGYSKFSEYTGTNTTDNAFVYCGFAPAWILVKSYGSGGSNWDWRIYDSTRNTYNPVDDHLEANQNLAENGDSRSNPIDFLSNGFKIRNSYAEVGSSTTYIFAAFAEHPFGGSGVNPATAR